MDEIHRNVSAAQPGAAILAQEVKAREQFLQAQALAQHRATTVQRPGSRDVSECSDSTQRSRSTLPRSTTAAAAANASSRATVSRLPLMIPFPTCVWVCKYVSECVFCWCENIKARSYLNRETWV